MTDASRPFAGEGASGRVPAAADPVHPLAAGSAGAVLAAQGRPAGD